MDVFSFVKPACGERDIVVAISVRCMCVLVCVLTCILACGFVRAINCTWISK